MPLNTPSPVVPKDFASQVVHALEQKMLLQRATVLPNFIGDAVNVPWVSAHLLAPVAAESAAITPNEPTYAGTVLNERVAKAAIQVTAEFEQDAIAGFDASLAECFAEASYRTIESAVVAALAPTVSLPLGGATFADLVKAIEALPAEFIGTAAWYGHPAVLANLFSAHDRGATPSPGALMKVAGFDLYPLASMNAAPQINDAAVYFGSMKHAAAIALKQPTVRRVDDSPATAPADLVEIHCRQPFAAGALDPAALVEVVVSA